jgi:hypothetical protein
MNSTTPRAKALLRAIFVFVALMALAPAVAQETVTYSYDSKGHLSAVTHTGGSADGANAVYHYDNADNRTTVTFGAATGGTTTITLSPTTLPNGTVGTAYSRTITASGGTSPYTFAKSSGTLPAGLALSSAGLLSGTPSAAGTSTFTVTATDSASNTGSQSYTLTIGSSGGTTIQLTNADHNLRTVANANGYTGSTTANYTFVVGSAVTITGPAGSGVGLDTGTWPSGVTLALQVNGIVRGGGGNGGTGGGSNGSSTAGLAGGAGGDAIQCHANIAIAINSGGTVQSGGGGGGGGGSTAQGGLGGTSVVNPGGGGGGGAPNGAGGAGGTGYNTANGTAGSPGTASGGGAGGSAPYPGGHGGTYATAGSAGVNGTYAGGAGGAAGYAVRKNSTGCTVTGTATGTIG